MQDAYQRSLAWSMDHRPLLLGSFFASLLATVALFMVMKQDFLPSQDTGQIRIPTEAADRTSFAQMSDYQMEADRIVRSDPSVEDVMSIVGFGGSRSGTNVGLLIVKLKDAADRPGKCLLVIPCPLSADQVIAELRPKLAQIVGLRAFPQNPPVIQIGGYASKAQYQYTLQDLDQDELHDGAERLVDALSKAPGFRDVTSDMDLASPSVNVTIDRDRAAALGVSPASIETALGAAFGGQQISTIYGASNQYWVMLELLPQFQADPSNLSTLYLSSNASTSGSGTSASTPPTGTGAPPTLVPLTAVTKLAPGTMPLSINHLGQLPAVTISFNLAQGMALSDAVRTIDSVQRQIGLPQGVQGSFQGTAQAYQSSTSNMGLLLAIALLTVYIVLGILYESFIHPLTILSGLPSAAVGALVMLWLASFFGVIGAPLTLYAFVGIMMLVGIVKKNAIMMIDFALNRQRSEDVSAERAIVEAAQIRFRPIMMTTMAAIMGTLPIALGFGVGSEARRPLGIAVAGGLLVSQVLTLYITPVIYTYLDGVARRFSRGRGLAVPRGAPAE